MISRRPDGVYKQGLQWTDQNLRHSFFFGIVAMYVLRYLTQGLSMMRGYKDEPELVEDMMPWSDLMQQSCEVNNAQKDS